MLEDFVKNNMTLTSIFIFMIIFSFIIYIKPSFLYKKDGSLREFGLGYKNRTILPIWLMSILIAIISYFLVLFFSSYNKIYF